MMSSDQLPNICELPNPERLKTLAFLVGYPQGNNLLHQFVLDNSHPNESGSANYLNAVLQSMFDIPAAAVNALNDKGYSALHLAVLKNNLLMVKKLLSCLVNIDVNTRCKARNDKQHNTALHLATELGYYSIIQELLNKGADVNLKGYFQNTALCYATKSGDLEAMILLVTEITELNMSDTSPHRIHVNAKDHGKMTPLHHAVISGNIASVEFLLIFGAHINAVDYDRKTPLHHAAKSGNLATVNSLVSHNANVNAKDECKRTALHYAAESGNLAIVDYLVINGADVNAENSLKETPLHLAAESGDLAIVNYLVGLNDVDVNAKDKYERTPLHYAVEAGNVATVQVLVSHGADVNAKDSSYRAPLHYAAISGNLAIVNSLRSDDAD